MKTSNAVVPYKSVKLDPTLARKFQEARNKKAGVEDFVRDFLADFLSDDTIKAYQKDMEFFFNFLRSGGVFIDHPSEIKSYHFQEYRDTLIEKGLAPATINRRLVAIRSFIKWCIGSRIIDHNPLDCVRLPKVQTVSPTVAFDDFEVVRMISAPDLTRYSGRRDRLCMVLLFNLGLRRNELVNIKMLDMYPDRGHVVLRIHGKGDKTRILPLSEYVLMEIKSYIDGLERAQVYLEANDYLIQTVDNRATKNQIPIDGSTVYRTINKYAKRLGINKRVSPHSCRATVISHLLDTQHQAIRDVATFAGHTNITTTERYDKRRENLDKSAAYEVNYMIGDLKQG